MVVSNLTGSLFFSFPPSAHAALPTISVAAAARTETRKYFRSTVCTILCPSSMFSSHAVSFQSEQSDLRSALENIKGRSHVNTFPTISASFGIILDFNSWYHFMTLCVIVNFWGGGAPPAVVRAYAHAGRAPRCAQRFSKAC